MLDTLARLMEEGRFQRCLTMAEQFVVQGGWSAAETAAIHLVICRCRLGIRDSYGAVAAGLLAVKLAREEGEHDLLGRALLNLGTAYVGVRNYDQALKQFYAYFDYLPHYRKASRLEGAIWKQIGIVHQHRLESKEAVNALERARQWFERNQIEYSAFTCNHDLINTYLQMCETDTESRLTDVKQLLGQQRKIARRNPQESFYQGTYLLDLAAYYQQEGRTARAMVAATQALDVHRGDRIHTFYCHLLLHRCGLHRRDARKALGHALAARVQAAEGRFRELEILASQAMADVIRQEGPEILRQLDAEYQAIGVDLGQYLAPWVPRRELQ